jgi:NRAMP (natural resistance-associated macrophage protein)-like metal ion transporter
MSTDRDDSLRESEAPPPRDSSRIARLEAEGNPLRRFFLILGPGLISGASDDDPSGIATYATVGATLGFVPLWTALATFPMMAAIQFVCAKIGMVSGMGIAGVVRRHYPRMMLHVAVWGLVVANTINVGADLGAIAEAISLLVPVKPMIMIGPVVGILLVLQIRGSYRLIAKVFAWLTLGLFAYIGAAFFARPAIAPVLRGTFIPTIQWNAKFFAALVAILGTTISPYLFFWQASQEVEEEKAEGKRTVRDRQGATEPELRYAAWDVIAGMLLSNVVMYFIILATAATLFTSGKHDIQTATDAAQALRPFVGTGASVLFAVGLIGAGLLAVPVLTGSAAYAVSEVFGWRYGLDQPPHRAKQFYGVIVAATLVGAVMNLLGIGAMRALFWTAVINGCVAPPLLVLIMLIGKNCQIMGSHTNGAVVNVIGWMTTLVMFAAAVGLITTWNAG